MAQGNYNIDGSVFIDFFNPQNGKKLNEKEVENIKKKVNQGEYLIALENKKVFDLTNKMTPVCNISYSIEILELTPEDDGISEWD